MIPYFLLLFIPLLCYLGLKFTNVAIAVGNYKIRNNNIILPIFFGIFLLLLILRDDTVGRDLSNYKIIFYSIGKGNIFQTYYDIREPVFQLINWFIYNYITQSYQVFLGIIAVITVLPIAFVYNKDKSHGYVKVVLFINMSTFIMLFSGIRQGLAMAFGMLAYDSLTQKKNIKFLAFAILATFTHHTGFMTFFLFPLYRMRFRKKDLFWIIPIEVFGIVANRQIFNLLASFMAKTDEKYSAVAGSTGAMGSFLLFVLFNVFCYLISDEEQMNDEDFALRNILMFATFLQSFASLNPLAMRMNYYFILLIPLAVGKSLECVKDEDIQIAKLGEIIISVFFTVMFVLSTYNSYMTGISALDTVPYIPFWKGI